MKLADFGLAREIRARPPFTDYVSTRWYRAPEVLLRSSTYNSPLDIWACGGIMAELYNLRPLFPGSSESDQLYKICSVLGTPTQAQWPEGFKLAAQIGFRFPSFVPTTLETLCPTSSPEGVRLMYGMMNWDPNKRMSCGKILQDAFFEAGSALEAGPTHLPQLDTKGSRPLASSREGDARSSIRNTSGLGGAEAILNNTKGSWREAVNSQSSRGILPPLQPESRKSSGAASGKSPGGRYLRMARYQPGMQQMPSLPAVSNAKANMSGTASAGFGGAMGAGPPKRDALPEVGSKPTGYFGAHGARMIG